MLKKDPRENIRAGPFSIQIFKNFRYICQSSRLK